MASVTLTIVCAKCKFDQFRLVAREVDAGGRGDVVAECCRCGSHEYAGIDPAGLMEVSGRSMDLVPKAMPL